jgi:hypothetical protein
MSAQLRTKYKCWLGSCATNKTYFPSSFRLSLHKSQKHNGEYICNHANSNTTQFVVPQPGVCKAEPRNAEELSGDNWITCPECSGRFQRIHDHMRVHDATDRPYECELGCSNFHFPSISARKTHYVATHKQVD